MNWNNKVTALLKIDFPILQAPMLGVATPEMTAAASDAGCLGGLPLGYASKDTALAKIRTVKSLTGKPFGVNIFAYAPPQSKGSMNDDALRGLFKKYDVPFFEEIPVSDPFESYEEILNIVMEEKIPVVSFHFGIPKGAVIEKLKFKGIVTLATATCVKEAEIIEAAGIDIVVAQGIEAGGNRGTFLEGPLPQVGLFALVPQISDRVKIPVIAAGGIMDGRTTAASFVLGAQGVQVGSVLLRSRESGAPASYKNEIARTTDTGTVVTNVWSGRYGRCIENEFTRNIDSKNVHPSPIQHYLTSKLREAGRQKEITDIQSLWAGQSAHYATEDSVKDILQRLIRETEEVVDRV